MAKLWISVRHLIAACSLVAALGAANASAQECDARGIAGRLNCAIEEMDREFEAREQASLDRDREYRTLEREQLVALAVESGVSAADAQALDTILAEYNATREAILLARGNDEIDREQMLAQAVAAQSARDAALHALLGEDGVAALDFDEAEMRASMAYSARPTEEPFVTAGNLAKACLGEDKSEQRICRGYILAVADSGRGGPVICVPRSLMQGRAPPGERIAAPVYMRLDALSYSEKRLPAYDIVAEALASAFPCPDGRQ